MAIHYTVLSTFVYNWDFSIKKDTNKKWSESGRRYLQHNIDKEFEYCIYKELLKKLTANPRIKMSKTLKQTLYKRGTPNGNKGIKKCFTSVRNANYNSSAKLLHTFPLLQKWQKSQNLTIPGVVKPQKFSYIAEGVEVI